MVKNKGRASRNKGKRGERELAAVLEKILGISFRRTQQFAGADGTSDVKCNELDLGLHIECKRQERIKIYDYLKQAKEDAENGDVPVVCFRTNNKPWVIAFELEYLMGLYDAITSTLIVEAPRETTEGSD